MLRIFAGVSEDALKEFSMMFKHFDKDKSGRLNHQEFKSCLRALGYDLPMVEEGQPDPEFNAILGKFVQFFFVAKSKLFGTCFKMSNVLTVDSESYALKIVLKSKHNSSNSFQFS